jgi:hypothetical protein
MYTLTLNELKAVVKVSTQERQRGAVESKAQDDDFREVKIIMLLKLSKDTKFPQNLCQISLLSTRGKLFENVIIKIVQRHIEERGLLNGSQFGFAHHTTFQCMRLTNHVTLNFKSNMSTTVVFLDIGNAFRTTWLLGLLYRVN